MIMEIFERLDEILSEENAEFRKTGMIELKHCEFKILGQMALLESKIDIELMGTADIDAYTTAQRYIIEKLNSILPSYGFSFDELSPEIWMPDETTYIHMHSGDLIDLYRADPVYVMVSKTIKAPDKNAALIAEYSSIAPREYFLLLEKYKEKK